MTEDRNTCSPYLLVKWQSVSTEEKATLWVFQSLPRLQRSNPLLVRGCVRREGCTFLLLGIVSSNWESFLHVLLCRSSPVLRVVLDVSVGKDKAGCWRWGGWENPPEFRFLRVAVSQVTLSWNPPPKEESVEHSSKQQCLCLITLLVLGLVLKFLSFSDQRMRALVFASVTVVGNPLFRPSKKSRLTEQIVKLPQSEIKQSIVCLNRSFSTLLSPNLAFLGKRELKITR